jgi:DNA-3-methyladenine glycosylase
VSRLSRGARVLPRSFYDRPTLDVARDLLGKVLVHRTRDGVTAGVIVETEAYIGERDPACHAAPGPTRRNEPLYGAPGRAYVYFSYGMHCLFNAVTERRGFPAAVLVRALEPSGGEDLMRARRGRPHVAAHDLCRGPGNLARALGITLAENRHDLTRAGARGHGLWIEDRGIEIRRVSWTPRIGIRVGTEHAWRCYVEGSGAVSGRGKGTVKSSSQ